MRRRVERVSQMLKQHVSQIILQELKDPRIGFVTVTKVKAAPDLRTARVYYSVMGSEAQRRTTERALSSARTRIQSEVGDRMSLKFTPKLSFQFDESIAGTARVSYLLDQALSGKAADEITEPPTPPRV